jgi:hypothetical protein
MLATIVNASEGREALAAVDATAMWASGERLGVGDRSTDGFIHST